MSIFNVNSGSIDELFSKKVLLNDKDVEQTLSTEYGRLYFDTSQDMDSDPGSNNFRISGPSWDQISSATITISKTNIVSAKQTKYKSVLDLISSTGASNYQLKVTSVNDSSVYKVFELVKVDTLLNHYRIWVKDIETGWNNLRLEQVPGDGEEFDLDFISPQIARIERFEFTTSQDWTVPTWANKITMVAVGAGGGGGGGGVTHLAVGPEQWAYGGGGGAGGNIAVKTINKSDLPKNAQGESELTISVGDQGRGGRGGEHPGAVIVMPGTIPSYMAGSGNQWYDIFDEQECSFTHENSVSNEWMDRFEGRTGAHGKTQVLYPGIFGYGYAYLKDYGNTAVKYGRHGTDGANSQIAIKGDTTSLVRATGGKGGRGGKISAGLCVKEFEPKPQTLSDVRNMAQGGAATAGNSIGDTIILGGPGGFGTVPNNVKDTPDSAWKYNFNASPKRSKDSGSGDIPIYRGSAPLFPFGIEGKLGSNTVWPKPTLPFNGSNEEPGEFGIPGGSGGAGVARWLAFTTDQKAWWWTRYKNNTPNEYTKENGLLEQELGYDFRYDWYCWGSDMHNYNDSAFTSIKGWQGGEYIYEIKHSISDVNSQGSGLFGEKWDDGCLWYPRYVYQDPSKQFNLPAYNTKITDFYGIPIGKYFGGWGGRFELTSKPNGVEDNIFNSHRMAYSNLIPPTTGSGYGVGGGGGQGMQYHYGTEYSSVFAKCYAENDFGVGSCHPKGANNEYRYEKGKPGSDGQNGFVVIICES
jgi:hypothetical protein